MARILFPLLSPSSWPKYPTGVRGCETPGFASAAAGRETPGSAAGDQK